MPHSDWLTLNGNRRYPFATDAAFDVDTAQDFPGNAAFLDAGFTPGIDSNFEPGRDSVNLDEWRITSTSVYFSFVVVYGGAAYDPFRCFRWVFEFDITASAGATSYSTPTRSNVTLGETAEENTALGFAFLTIGNIDQIVAAMGQSAGTFTLAPQVEPAALQTQHLMYVKNISVANEPRPCPPACPCDDSSSSSVSSLSSSSTVSSSSSSLSSSSSESPCTDPVPPEPTAASVPAATALPSGVFTGAAKLKEGYNCAIDVTGNVIQISDGLEQGEGMQCEDLRMTATGAFEENSCVVCGGWLYAINGQGFDVEQFQLIGGPSVIIDPDPANHRIVVRFEEEGICEVDI